MNIDRAAIQQMAKKKHPGGRPRTYTPELLDELADSLLNWVAENIEADNKKILLGDWCFKVGFQMQNFKRYALQNENFKNAYEWAKQWQEFNVVKGALFNELNPKFAQFFLCCNHGWKMHTGNDDKEEKAKSRLQEVSEQLQAIQLSIEHERTKIN